MRKPIVQEALNLRVGEVVEVRSESEILATLDENGELDSMPFMPEMLQFCGRRFKVDKVAVKTCDTIAWTGMYQVRNAVHLEGTRCDGRGHSGCQAGCNIYWKDAWLSRVEADDQSPSTPPDPPPNGASRCTVATLRDATRKRTGASRASDECFSCQATELRRAAPTRIPSWEARQYVTDVRSGNTSWMAMVSSVCIGAFNEFQDASKKLLPRMLLIRGGRRFPVVEGKLKRTPEQTLDLRPGELVRVKSKEEIVATLDANNRNRGMSFDVEMLRYCGREARVLQRVDQIIDEKTGRMLRMKTPCIVLEGVCCTGAYHRCCPRGTYAYWREIWLERVQRSS
jgi:hypothetical protein